MENIKDRIKKLLALASSPNEHEAKAALLKAKKLMAEHKLTDSDFEDRNREIAHQDLMNVKWTTDSGKIWMVKLCQLICDNYCCVASWKTPQGSRTHILTISGFEDDVQVCSEVTKYAVGFIDGRVKNLKRKYKNSDPKSITNSYADGFIVGLEMAFEDQSQDHQEWGLVMVKPEEVKKFEDSLSSRNVKTRESSFDPLAYAKGQIDGSRFNSRKVIGNA